MRAPVTFLLLLSAFVSAATEGELVLTFAPSGDGQYRVFTMPQSNAAALPEWTPGNGEPPLPLSSALAKADERLRSQAPAPEELTLAHIHLTKKVAPGAPDIWFYMIIFTNSVKTKWNPSESYHVVLLMDGQTPASRVISEQELHELMLGGEAF